MNAPREKVRIAMWSGPRNISTALMRSWGNREDTFVCDEPFYAHYLKRTGTAHPGAEEVMKCHETDWRKVVEWLTGDVPEGRTIFYQKQMAHHLLPEISRDWLGKVVNCFLIRDPREMLTSLMRILPRPQLTDTGLPQQVEILRWVQNSTGQVPPVVDARDVLENPERVLRLLCERLGVEFSSAMLQWPPGQRSTDGVWAKHWYGEVEKSTSFRAYKPKPDAVPDFLQEVYEQAVGLYEELYRHRSA